MTDAEPMYDVVWPKSPKGVEPKSLAPRLTSLDGATIGFLWDYLFRGEEVFPALEAELQRRFPTTRFVGYDVFGNTHGPDEAAVVAAIAGQLADHGVTAVVSAMGC